MCRDKLSGPAFAPEVVSQDCKPHGGEALCKCLRAHGELPHAVVEEMPVLVIGGCHDGVVEEDPIRWDELGPNPPFGGTEIDARGITVNLRERPNDLVDFFGGHEIRYVKPAFLIFRLSLHFHFTHFMFIHDRV